MRIIRVMFLFWLFLGYASTIHAHKAPGKNRNFKAGNFKSREHLQLTTNVIERQYCSTTSLRLTLQLNFTNIGQQPLILYKNSSAVGRYMVSRDHKLAAARRYEMDVSPMINLMLMPILSEDLTLNDTLFVILKPGYSHKLNTVVNLGVTDGGNAKTDYLPVGEHNLQVKVWTWYGPRGLAVKMRKRWRSEGILLYEPVTSLPMPFSVDKNRSVSECK